MKINHYDKESRMISMGHFPKDLYDYFNDKGFFFSKEILTRFYLSLKTKPFVILTGISGTGKTKIAQLFASYICQEDDHKTEAARIAFVPVRPDWMDNKGILGFFNILDEKYHSTKVLDLLLHAKDNPELSCFVILDEMNLAKVEHYFSDFLSILESRTPDNPKGETISLHSNRDVVSTGGAPIPRDIRIPNNVFFVGTVNVDESTYMFSPKVLDRANVIEFNEVSLENYAGVGHPEQQIVLKNTNVLDHFFEKGTQPLCTKQDFNEYHQHVEEDYQYLRQMLNILQKYNLHFGYRVVNELSKFINLSDNEVDNFQLDDCFDIQILQKILPKFHGTRAKLEEPLSELFVFCYENSEAVSDDLLSRAREYDTNARFPRSAKKLAQMIGQLTVQGYTSFIE